MLNVKYNLWLSILTILLAHFVMDFMLAVWSIYKTLANLDLVVAGLIASVGMFIGEGLQLYFGVLSDRGFHRHLIMLGIGLTAAVSFLPYTDNSWILFLCVLSSLVGSGAFHPAATSILAINFSKYKSLIIALFACGGMIGAASSHYVFMKLYSALEGHTAVLAIPIIILMICCGLFSLQIPESENSKIDFKLVWKAIKPQRFELVFLYLIQVCLQIVVLSFSFLLPDLLIAKGYEDWLCLGGGNFYFIIGSALTSIPIGYCIDKWGYRSILGFIIVSSIGLLNLLLVTESLSLFPIITLLMLIGGTMGVIVPVVVAGGNSLVPSYASGFISALYMGGATCLAGFGPILVSLIATYFTDNAPIIALQLLSSLLVVSLGLFYFLPHPSRKFDLEQDSLGRIA